MDHHALRAEQPMLPSHTLDPGLLPTLALSNGREVTLDEALRYAPRLLIQAPYGSGVDALLDYLELKPTAPGARLILPLPQPLPPQLEPVAVLSEMIEKLHVDLPASPLTRARAMLSSWRGASNGQRAHATAERYLTSGQVVWLIRGADQLAEDRAAWLARALDQYPLTRAVAVARAMPTAPLFTVAAFITAQLRPPAWPVVERHLADNLAIAEPILAWIGRRPDLRDALAASPLLRDALALTTRAGQGVRGLYEAWIRLLLGASEPDVVARAAALAWQAQVETLREPPDDAALAKLVYQPGRGRWVFGFPAAQRYLAAQSASATAVALAPRASDAEWAEVIALWAGMSPEAPDFVTALLRRPDEVSLILALRMLTEMRTEDGRRLEARVLARALNWLSEQRVWADERRARYRALSEKSLALVRALADYQGMTEKSQPVQVALALANHASPQVRLAAIDALGGLEDNAVQLKLRERLGDPDPDVARAAARTLGASGVLAIDYLVPLLRESDSAMRALAIVALGAIGDPAAERLTEELTRGAEQTRQGAASALAEMGRPGLEKLLTFLSAPSEPTRQAVHQALVERGRQQPELLLDALKTFLLRHGSSPRHDAIVQLLRDAGAPIVPTLTREARRQGGLAGLAVEALDRYSAPGASRLDVNGEAETAVDPVAILGLVYGLRDERVAVRIRATSALKKLGRRAAPVMLSIIATRPALQPNALALLVEVDDPALIDLVVPQLIELLDTAQADDGSIGVRQTLIQLLGRSTSPVAWDRIMAALEDPSPYIRTQVVQLFATKTEDRYVRRVTRQLASEEAPEVKAALLTTLCAQSPVRALPFALNELAHPSDVVRQAAKPVFSQAGLDGVNALIERVCSPQQQARRQGERENFREQAVVILKEIVGRPAGDLELTRTVAQVWRALLTEPMSAVEAREKALSLRRWSYAREVISSYDAASTFVTYRTIDDLRDVPRMLYWTQGVTTWLRPDVGDFFRGLRSVSSRAIAFYEKRHIDDLKQLHDDLAELEKKVDPGRLDLQPFLDIIEPWRRLISNAVSNLYDKPDLTLKLLSSRVRLSELDGPINLVFALTNEGAGAAREIFLRVSKSRFEEDTHLALREPWDWQFNEIETGGTVLIELAVDTNGSSKLEASSSISVPFRLIYEDTAQKTYVPDSDILVHVPVEQASSPSGLAYLGANPYVAGPPVFTDNLFFGRNEILSDIFHGLDKANDAHNHLVIVHGERRTGKTSLLRRMEHMVMKQGPGDLFVLVDFQDMDHGETARADPFAHLAKCLREQLYCKNVALDDLGADFASLDSITQFRRLRDQTVEKLGDGRLVLMLDEFDILLAEIEHGKLNPAVLSQLRNLYQDAKRTFLIVSGLHRTRRLTENYRSILYGQTYEYHLTFLDQSDALRLIQDPVAGQVIFSRPILERMYRATHGHPFFVQVLCSRLFERLRDKKRGEVDYSDLMWAMRETLDVQSRFYKGLYDDLEPAQKFMVAAIAHNVQPGRLIATAAEIDQLLETYHVDLPPEQRKSVLDELIQRDLIEVVSRGEKPGYRFAMDLTREWFNLSLNLAQELRDLADRLR